MMKNVKIVHDTNGDKVVLINDIRFKGKRRINWKEVEKYLKEYVGKVYEIAECSEKIYIGNDFPDEFAGSKDTERLKGTLAKAKANASQGIPEIISIAGGRTFSVNYEEKHEKNARFGWYRFDSKFALPVYGIDGIIERYNIFTVRMLIRHAEDEKMYLYDFVRIKKETSTPLEL